LETKDKGAVTRLTLFSPAKLNLFFRVLRKRPDGFHDIASLFQAINLGDTLSLSLKEGEDVLYCSDPTIPTDQSNLVLRAANLFREKTGIAQGFHFDLQKNIPAEAGLGGGSGNAATTLWGLNELMQTKIDAKTLAQWGSEIGSDVAFFFMEGTAYGEGRGEILSNLPAAKSPSFWIAKLKGGLSTPAVFKSLKIEKLEKRDPKKCLHDALEGIYFNDLEIPAFALKPSLKDLKETLLQYGFTKVHMTGSGTAFVCMGDISSPKIPDIDFYPVQFLNRSSHDWYKFP